MFEARLSSTTLLKRIVDALKDLISQSTLDCSNSGIQLQSIDNSHVSLVSMSLQADCFEKYRCDRNLSLGLDLKSLTKVLKCANGDDAVTISAEDKADKIQLKFESLNKERTAEYELRLLNLEQDRLDIPDTDYPCIVHMPATEFARICRDLTTFSESIAIACSKEGIKFSASGEIGSVNITFSESTKGDVTVQVEEPLTLSFAGRYLNSFTRATPLSEKVKIGMAPDMPLLVEYPIEDYGFIRYYLAPKFDWPD